MNKNNTRYLMILASFVTGVLGICASYFPEEILNVFNIPQHDLLRLILQLAGALYVGFAIMNWMAKTVLIGGIYAKPLAMGNFAHFFIGAISLVKFSMATPDISYVWMLTVVYSIFAILFGLVAFTHPRQNKGM